MRKISVQTWNTFQAINIFVNDFLAENVQVEIILRRLVRQREYWTNR